MTPCGAPEQQKQFVLQPGYRIAPVLTEPDIKEPGAIAFDGNGRIFVLELRGYMQDADATGELDPVGRISRPEDAANDGVVAIINARRTEIQYDNPISKNVLNAQYNADGSVVASRLTTEERWFRRRTT